MQTTLGKKSLWKSVDERRHVRRQLRGAPTPPEPKPGSGLFKRSVLPVTLAIVAGVGVLLPQELSSEARVALFGFALATVLWSTTKINPAYVALGAVMVTIFGGGSSQEAFFESLASDVIWLMIGAFILGGAMRSTGLAARLTGVVVNRARTVRGVFFMVTTVLLPLSFFIPSTSGRAAVMMPVFRSLSDTINDKKVTRALALLIPTVILVATISTLIGAGSHLIAIDLLDEISDESIPFAQWALWGVPFGVTAAYLSCLVVMFLFLDRERLNRPIVRRERAGDEPGEATAGEKRLSRNEKFTLVVLLTMVGLWLTEATHGIEIATVTVAGALILTLPLVGVMKWKEGLPSVS